jgi:hypothetical protein
LFFDTYEQGEDVRRHSGRIVKLLDILPQTHAPPVLLFSMGCFYFQTSSSHTFIALPVTWYESAFVESG